MKGEGEEGVGGIRICHTNDCVLNALRIQTGEIISLNMDKFKYSSLALKATPNLIDIIMK